METTYIYGLVEKNSNIVKYVGKTNNLRDRRTEHIREAIKGCKTHKCNWIRQVINSNSDIDIILLEEVGLWEWERKEIEWIKKLKPTLTNHREGGYSSPGNKGDFLKYSELKTLIETKYNFITSAKQWYTYFKNNKNKLIPSNPPVTYKNKGWISWGEFLNTKNISLKNHAQNYLDYETTKKWVLNSNLKINSGVEWVKLSKLNIFPDFIPNNPEKYFKNRGWEGWLCFLNLNKQIKTKKQYLTYENAKIWIKIYLPKTINTVSKWVKFNNPNITNIPTDAWTYYQKTAKWENWNIFLNKV